MQNILIYSTPTCPYCKMAKAYLKEHKIDFTDIDVSTNASKAQEMIDKSGQMGVPVIDIDGEIIVGFDQKKIAQLLDIK